MLFLESEKFVFHGAGDGKFEATGEIFGLTSRGLDQLAAELGIDAQPQRSRIVTQP